MKHKKKIKKLGRKASHRKALLKNLATELLRYGRIKTTLGRAKALRPLIDKLIIYAKRNTLHTRRLVLRYTTDKEILRKLFEIIGPRFAERSSGFTRIIKMHRRLGDGAPMAIIELVE